MHRSYLLQSGQCKLVTTRLALESRERRFRGSARVALENLATSEMGGDKTMSSSNKDVRIAIVGCGMAGVTAAQSICDAFSCDGDVPRVRISIFEAGRKAGGRIASRKSREHPGLCFDHGCPALPAPRSAEFRDQLEAWRAEGLIFDWRTVVTTVRTDRGGRMTSDSCSKMASDKQRVVSCFAHADCNLVEHLAAALPQSIVETHFNCRATPLYDASASSATRKWVVMASPEDASVSMACFGRYDIVLVSCQNAYKCPGDDSTQVPGSLLGRCVYNFTAVKAASPNDECSIKEMPLPLLKNLVSSTQSRLASYFEMVSTFYSAPVFVLMIAFERALFDECVGIVNVVGHPVVQRIVADSDKRRVYEARRNSSAPTVEKVLDADTESGLDCWTVCSSPCYGMRLVEKVKTEIAAMTEQGVIPADVHPSDLNERIRKRQTQLAELDLWEGLCQYLSQIRGISLPGTTCTIGTVKDTGPIEAVVGASGSVEASKSAEAWTQFHSLPSSPLPSLRSPQSLSAGKDVDTLPTTSSGVKVVFRQCHRWNTACTASSWEEISQATDTTGASPFWIGRSSSQSRVPKTISKDGNWRELSAQDRTISIEARSLPSAKGIRSERSGRADFRLSLLLSVSSSASVVESY